MDNMAPVASVPEEKLPGNGDVSKTETAAPATTDNSAPEVVGAPRADRSKAKGRAGRYQWKKKEPGTKRANDDWDTPREERQAWVKSKQENEAFEKFYKIQKIVPEDEWDQFMAALRRPLPTSFRIVESTVHTEAILNFVQESQPKILPEQGRFERLEWYPTGLAFELTASRTALRSSPELREFHQYLVNQSEVGTIYRQETVSMIPALFMDVKHDSLILDMCAAPGSKTSQLVEAMHRDAPVGPFGEREMPTGLICANDANTKRAHMLIHHLRYLHSPSLVVTSHAAQVYPNMFSSDTGARRTFDGVLCDVPCSSDGTLRKSPNLWERWHPNQSLGCHRLQHQILRRGLEVCKVGGCVVYSTCTFSPLEDEAVIASVLAASEGAVELVDLSDRLPQLRRNQGLNTWRVYWKGEFYEKFEDIPPSRDATQKLRPTMFPPTADVASAFNLDRCLRFLPHFADTGGFFVAKIRKLGPCPWEARRRQTVPANTILPDLVLNDPGLKISQIIKKLQDEQQGAEPAEQKCVDDDRDDLNDAIEGGDQLDGNDETALTQETSCSGPTTAAGSPGRASNSPGKPETATPHSELKPETVAGPLSAGANSGADRKAEDSSDVLPLPKKQRSEIREGADAERPLGERQSAAHHPWNCQHDFLSLAHFISPSCQVGGLPFWNSDLGGPFRFSLPPPGGRDALRRFFVKLPLTQEGHPKRVWIASAAAADLMVAVGRSEPVVLACGTQAFAAKAGNAYRLTQGGVRWLLPYCRMLPGGADEDGTTDELDMAGCGNSAATSFKSDPGSFSSTDFTVSSPIAVEKGVEPVVEDNAVCESLVPASDVPARVNSCRVAFVSIATMAHLLEGSVEDPRRPLADLPDEASRSAAKALPEMHPSLLIAQYPTPGVPPPGRETQDKSQRRYIALPCWRSHTSMELHVDKPSRFAFKCLLKPLIKAAAAASSAASTAAEITEATGSSPGSMETSNSV
eukprot:GHVT01001102.1.p1 GENE.GHVT01001102.1~~GHVT01001102.1.p1  ORF type:complete len:976 (+),score=151.56 GHVT01001102.1:2400-5327(+)